MRKKSVPLWILGVSLLGVLLRVAGFGSLPSGLHMDEVSFGYNAWSIAETGRDEFGVLWPLAFRAYDDWRPPVYPYLAAGSVAIFGRSEAAVRLPSLLAGLALPVLIYAWLAAAGKRQLGQVAMAVAWVNPALVMLSRVAHDAPVALAGLLFGVWMWEKARQSREMRWWLLALLGMGVAAISYQASKVHVPVVVAYLVWRDRAAVARQWKSGRLFGAAVVVVAVGVLGVWSQAGGTARLLGLAVWHDGGLAETAFDRYQILGSGSGVRVGVRAATLLGEVWKRYADYLNPGYWFGTGAGQLYKVPGMGFFYPFELLLLVMGASWWKKNHKGRLGDTIMLLGLAAPLPAAVLMHQPLLTRSLPLVPALCVAIAAGILGLAQSRRWRWIVLGGYLLGVSMLVAGLGWWIRQEQAEMWPGWYPGVVAAVAEEAQMGEEVCVETGLTAAYIYFLWYGRVQPGEYLAYGGTQTGNVMKLENRWGRYRFQESCEGAVGLRVMRVSKRGDAKGKRIVLPEELGYDIGLVR